MKLKGGSVTVGQSSASAQLEVSQLWRKIWSEVSWGNEEVRRREVVLSRNSSLTDSMHQGELTTAYAVNLDCATPNLRLSCVQAIFQTFPLPMYLYLSSSQSIATISSLNSLTYQPWAACMSWSGYKKGLPDTDWTLHCFLTERPEKKGEEKNVFFYTTDRPRGKILWVIVQLFFLCVYFLTKAPSLALARHWVLPTCRCTEWMNE